VRLPPATLHVAGFEHREDAERFLSDLRDRFAEFGLVLHPEKTRLIEFGRFAAQNRARRGDRKPETFDYLGLTHMCATDRHGRFKLKRVTSKKKMRSKLKSVKTEMRRRMHHPIPEQARWLARVLQGPSPCVGAPMSARTRTTAPVWPDG
jgi:RNA-directed DNA polymerase